MHICLFLFIGVYFVSVLITKLVCAQGCDASVLLSSPNNNAEKDHPDDTSLAGDGFDTVVKAKAAVDRDARCRNKVSCADILALATRDVVNLVLFHHLLCDCMCYFALWFGSTYFFSKSIMASRSYSFIS